MSEVEFVLGSREILRCGDYDCRQELRDYFSTIVCLSRACYHFMKKCRQAAGGRLSPRNQIVATFHGAAEKFGESKLP